MADAVRFIKISKKDKNGVDKTISLQSLSEITIPYSTGNVRYKILNIIEKPTYFLYEVNNPNLEWADRAEVEYILTGSVGGSYNDPAPNPSNPSKQSPSLLTPITDPFNFVIPITIGSREETGNGYSLNTYPQKDIYIYATGSVHFEVESGTIGAISPRVRLLKINKDNTTTTLDEDVLSPSILPTDTTLTRSFEVSYNIPSGSIPGEIYYIGLLRQGAATNIVLSSSFSDTSFLYITSSVSSGLALETIPEPFFSEDFDRALDCQPLLNNAVNNRLSFFHQDIDYSSGILTPTNFELLISGSALKASIQDSNYTLKRHTNPRYDGSRSTSQNLNTWTSGDTGTFGKQPNVENLDTTIFEFAYGGGTSPEIVGGGAILLSQAINVNGKDDVRIIPTTDEYFDEILQRKFLPTTTPNVTQYTSTSNNTGGAKVIATNLGVPPISNYLIITAAVSAIGTAVNNTTLDITSSLQRVAKNSNGYYIGGATENNITNKISESINNGEEWYITIFNTLTDPVGDSLEPFNSGSDYDYTQPNSDGTYPEPLARNGVYKIVEINAPQKYYIVFPPLPEASFDLGNSDKGCLIWKAIDRKDITFDEATFSGVGKGAITTTTTTQTVEENLQYITKTYGTNT